MPSVTKSRTPALRAEEQLFGHMRRSFTGAYRDKCGRLEAAHKGTINFQLPTSNSQRTQSREPRALC
jgi:DNA-binding NtrC family response regulator